MKNLMIEPTKYTPRIYFDGENNILEIIGKSYPENTSVFFAPVFKWLDEYLTNCTASRIQVNIDLIYFNSSSSKVLMDLCDKLEDAVTEHRSIVVNWMYEEEDEDSKEFGEEFKEDYDKLEFNLIMKSV